jgi:predicted dehydrogenase
LRVGVIGIGYWGSKHVRVLVELPEVSQVVAVDSRPDRSLAVRQSFPTVVQRPSLDSALDLVDAIIVATPPTTHAAIGLQALAAGKHVLIEKPLATNSFDAQQLIDAAAAKSLTLMAGHTFQFNAAVWKLRDTVMSGELGTVHYIDTARLNLGVYQNDVNVIWDLAPHDISIVTYLLGKEPATVQAWGSCHAHSYLEDVAYLRLEYPNIAATAQIHVSWLDPCKVRRVTVVGSRKMAVYNDVASDEKLRIYDKGVASVSSANVNGNGVRKVGGQDLHTIPMSYRYGSITSPFIAFQEPLTIQDRHFVECIRDGKRPVSDGDYGLAVVRMLEAAQQSLQEGGPVHLDERQEAQHHAG